MERKSYQIRESEINEIVYRLLKVKGLQKKEKSLIVKIGNTLLSLIPEQKEKNKANEMF